MRRRFALVLVVLLAGSGCAALPPLGTQCAATRPSWAYHEAAPVRARKTVEARRWDRQCTVVGVIGSAW